MTKQTFYIDRRPSQNYERRALRRPKVDFFCDRDKLPGLAQMIVRRVLDDSKGDVVGWRVDYYDDNFPERDHANQFYIQGRADKEFSVNGLMKRLLDDPFVDVVYFGVSREYPYRQDAKVGGGWIMINK